jgi:hypothetical protein
VGIDGSLMSEVGSLRFLAAENAEVAKIELSKWKECEIMVQYLKIANFNKKRR